MSVIIQARAGVPSPILGRLSPQQLATVVAYDADTACATADGWATMLVGSAGYIIDRHGRATPIPRPAPAPPVHRPAARGRAPRPVRS
jgi:hypothetical protein